jgi:hypothetical protein
MHGLKRIALGAGLALALLAALVGGSVTHAGSASAHAARPTTGCTGGVWRDEFTSGDDYLNYNGHFVEVNTRLRALETNDGTFRFCGQVYARLMWLCDDCAGQGNAPTVEIFHWKGTYSSFSQIGYANNGTASHSDGVWHTVDTPIFNQCTNISSWAQATLQQDHSQKVASGILVRDDPFC